MRDAKPNNARCCQHAGVSVQTVSYVVNRTGNISDETRHARAAGD